MNGKRARLPLRLGYDHAGRRADSPRRGAWRLEHDDHLRPRMVPGGCGRAPRNLLPELPRPADVHLARGLRELCRTAQAQIRGQGLRLDDRVHGEDGLGRSGTGQTGLSECSLEATATGRRQSLRGSPSVGRRPFPLTAAGSRSYPFLRQSAGRPPLREAEESPGSKRTRRRITSGGGDPRDSATESRPPASAERPGGQG